MEQVKSLAQNLNTGASTFRFNIEHTLFCVVFVMVSLMLVNSVRKFLKRRHYFISRVSC